jgi:hypothetical protein
MADIEINELSTTATGLSDGDYLVRDNGTNTAKITWANVIAAIKTALGFSTNLLTHEKGGLEADVSAYDGLVKISGGSTSAIGLDTDNTLTANSDTKVASQKAVKAYVDGIAGDVESALDAILGV